MCGECEDDDEEEEEVEYKDVISSHNLLFLSPCSCCEVRDRIVLLFVPVFVLNSSYDN
jgi:hypothetical protein